MKLFELYEARKNRFKPGTIWKDKGSHIVKELEIVSYNNLNTIPYHMNTKHDHINGSRVIFRIIRSGRRPHDILGKGTYESWSKEYIEDNYEPVFE